VVSNHSKLTVVRRSVGDLKPYPRNARRHSRKQLRKIAESLQRFGWTNPILVDEDGMVLAGHGRLEAAQMLGWEFVETICLAGFTDEGKRAYILADNRIAEEAGWDRDLLAVEFSTLIEDGFQVELTGFDTIEIDRVLGFDVPSEPDEERVDLPDESEVAVSRLGDVFTIGGQVVIAGNARDPTAYRQLLGDERAQMIFTDPPYGGAIANYLPGKGKAKHREFVEGSANESGQAFVQGFLLPAFERIAENAEDGAIAYVCCDWRHLREFLDATDAAFAELKNIICWVKTNASLGGFLRSQYELILACKVKSGKHINNSSMINGGRHRSNVWTYPGANTFRKGRLEDLASHVTVKPRKLVSDAILDCSKPGGLILDPYLGSGTTLLSAAATGRRGRGIELDPLYVDVAVRRLEAELGVQAVHASGDTFRSIADQRAAEREVVDDE
jgi:DNA modification methylase